MRNKAFLLQAGITRMSAFCGANALPEPDVIVVPRRDWAFDACAYWRPNYIEICLEKCAWPAPVENCRNWNWPGSVVDREPYGVIAHETGHLADWTRSGEEGLPRGAYGGMVSRMLREESGEKPLTGYCPNDAEWFAEHFRLFVTNHELLRLVRPRTHALFVERWKPVSGNWREELTSDVPARIVKALMGKMPVRERRLFSEA